MELMSNGAADAAALDGGVHPSQRAPTGADGGSPAAVPPLAISGLVVAKGDLVAALRIYVPTVVDVAALDGDRFILGLRHGS